MTTSHRVLTPSYDEPTDEPGSNRNLVEQLVEQIVTNGAWIREAEKDLRTHIAKTDQQHDVVMLAVLSLTDVAQRHTRHLESIDLSLGVLARDGGARATQDSLHDKAIESVRKHLTWRQGAVYVLGGSGAVALTIAANILARIIMGPTGHQ